VTRAGGRMRGWPQTARVRRPPARFLNSTLAAVRPQGPNDRVAQRPPAAAGLPTRPAPLAPPFVVPLAQAGAAGNEALPAPPLQPHLHRDLVLVERQQLADRVGVELGQQHAEGGAVAGEGPGEGRGGGERGKRVGCAEILAGLGRWETRKGAGHPGDAGKRGAPPAAPATLRSLVGHQRLGHARRPQLLGALARCEGVRLSEEVGHELIVVGHGLALRGGGGVGVGAIVGG
jgi:hypothetical protein